MSRVKRFPCWPAGSVNTSVKFIFYDKSFWIQRHFRYFGINDKGGVEGPVSALEIVKLDKECVQIRLHICTYIIW